MHQPYHSQNERHEGGFPFQSQLCPFFPFLFLEEMQMAVTPFAVCKCLDRKNSPQLVQFSELPSAHLHLLIFLFICFPYFPRCYWSCKNEHIKAISSSFFAAPMSSLPPLLLTLILIATIPFFTVAFFLIPKGVSLFLDFLLL